MRFTIRDVLFVTVIVALACALFLVHRERWALVEEVVRLTGRLEDSQRDRYLDDAALRREIERVTGRRLEGMSKGLDGTPPDGYWYEFRYGEEIPAESP